MQAAPLYHQLVVHNSTVYLAGQTANFLTGDGATYTGQLKQVGTLGTP